MWLLEESPLVPRMLMVTPSTAPVARTPRDRPEPEPLPPGDAERPPVEAPEPEPQPDGDPRPPDVPGPLPPLRLRTALTEVGF